MQFIETSHVVGHDWGAVISYAAAVRQLHRFTRVTALSVPPFAALNDTSIVRSVKMAAAYTLVSIAGLSEASLSDETTAPTASGPSGVRTGRYLNST